MKYGWWHWGISTMETMMFCPYSSGATIHWVWDGRGTNHIIPIHVWGVLQFIVVLWQWACQGCVVQHYRTCCWGVSLGLEAHGNVTWERGRLGIVYNWRHGDSLAFWRSWNQVSSNGKMSSWERFVPNFIGQSKPISSWSPSCKNLYCRHKIKIHIKCVCWNDICRGRLRIDVILML